MTLQFDKQPIRTACYFDGSVFPELQTIEVRLVLRSEVAVLEADQSAFRPGESQHPRTLDNQRKCLRRPPTFKIAAAVVRTPAIQWKRALVKGVGLRNVSVDIRTRR
jgi:hypothetical protein